MRPQPPGDSDRPPRAEYPAPPGRRGPDAGGEPYGPPSWAGLRPSPNGGAIIADIVPRTAPATPHRLEAQILGGLALRYDGQPVPETAFRRRRSRTLLLLLLV